MNNNIQGNEVRCFKMRSKNIHMIIIVFLLLGMNIPCVSAVIPPVIQWQKSLGGSSTDQAQSIVISREGGYAVAGWSQSSDGDVSGNHGSGDFWVVRLDASGNILWQKSLGGSGMDVAQSVQQTSDNGYIVAGATWSNDGDVSGNHGNGDYWVVKLDSGGNLQWQKTFGGSGIDNAFSVNITHDGNYIVAGWTQSNGGDVTGYHGGADFWIVKLDPVGNILWERSLGGSEAEHAWASFETIDGGFIIAGDSKSNDGDVTGNHGNEDYWVVKLDPDGNPQWQKSLGGSNQDAARAIHQTDDGGYVVTGWSNSNDGDVTGNHGDEDYWVVKLDPSGNIEWQKSLGGLSQERAKCIQYIPTAQGVFVLAGFTRSPDGDVTGNHGNEDYWVVELDPSGNLQWQKSLGGSSHEEATSVQQDPHGGWIIAGSANSNDGDVTGNHGNEDFWVVKLSPENPITPTPTTSPFSPVAVVSAMMIIGIYSVITKKRI